jgi:hypothetical protein
MPDFITLDTVNNKTAHHCIVIRRTSASGIFEQSQHGMYSYSEYPACPVDRIALYQSRYDLAPLGCA